MLGLSNSRIRQAVARVRPTHQFGRIESIQGTISAKLRAAVGDLCHITNHLGTQCLAEVIGFRGDLCQVMPLGSGDQLQRGDRVVCCHEPMQIPVGPQILGRVLNVIGEPMDELGPLPVLPRIRVAGAPPAPLQRSDITEVMATGQRSIDGLATLGDGQRVGLFGGSGVGKSTLLGQIARYASADVNVVMLVGERSREVAPFIRQSLGPGGLAKSVVVVATADDSPLARVRAAETGIAYADWFRAQGKRVLVILDSLTRFAMAQRELGLMLGEPPTARGYTPSVFHKMALLLERMGNSDRGSVTGIITVLVEGDDLNDPIADAARSILDGHIVLSRRLANAGHFPAVDILASNSRMFLELADPQHKWAATAIRQILARYDEVADLLQIGAYQAGVSPATDRAIELYPKIMQMLRQDLNRPSSWQETTQQLVALAAGWKG